MKFNSALILGTLVTGLSIASGVAEAVVSTVGPQGPIGKTGPAGPVGKTGPVGPQGLTGKRRYWLTRSNWFNWSYGCGRY